MGLWECFKTCSTKTAGSQRLSDQPSDREAYQPAGDEEEKASYHTKAILDTLMMC